ncbi:hypothetical protein ACEWY4_020909 [Coilia grayii]|uniref:DNA-directed DNA polymerase X domain-containing protein n=1 Tax=Coilia grayii TaxID=363190 RepID=A0ABD1JAP8_9TELE
MGYTRALWSLVCRGKEFGHDVDYILTTPDTGNEEGLLLRVIDRLNYQGILLYTEYQESTYDKSRLPCRRFEAMDHFPKCFLIIKLHAEAVPEGALSCDPGDRRGWRAVRLDLVAPPADRFAFALLGWTGSTQFERDLRRFARLERGMLLDNHALYDKSKIYMPQPPTVSHNTAIHPSASPVRWQPVTGPGLLYRALGPHAGIRPESRRVLSGSGKDLQL